jgi:DNA ligase (NAD+)
MGIPNIGRSAAKTIAQHFNGDLSAFVRETVGGFNYTTLDDFGQVAHDSIYQWLMNFSKKDLVALSQYLTFNTDEYKEQNVIDNPFNGKNVAVTGKLNSFTRDSINAKLESLGAKSVSSVTSKTDYLINNDSTSQSSKNKKANELNIPIITEDQFLKMICE